MPEGDTIHRAARTLHAALAGQRIERFESVFPHLTRVDAEQPIAGRRVERVEARGKHLLMWSRAIWCCGPTCACTAHGTFTDPANAGSGRGTSCASCSKRRPTSRWRLPYRSPSSCRPTVSTAWARSPNWGPTRCPTRFDAAEACARLAARPDVEIADALLDQRALAGIGNVFKSEVLFAARASPFTRVRALPAEQLTRLVAIAVRQMQANVGDTAAAGRRTTNRLDPSARLWVYGRRGLPCRRCGAPIQRAKQGPDARSTYWCARCQPGLKA